jgi:hypothetical protein
LETEAAAATAALQGWRLCCQKELLQVRLAVLASLLLLPLRLSLLLYWQQCCCWCCWQQQQQQQQQQQEQQQQQQELLLGLALS